MANATKTHPDLVITSEQMRMTLRHLQSVSTAIEVAAFEAKQTEPFLSMMRDVRAAQQILADVINPGNPS